MSVFKLIQKKEKAFGVAKGTLLDGSSLQVTK